MVRKGSEMAADRVVVSLATKSFSEALLDLERSLDYVGYA
jgi:hypothetical protein